MLLSSSVLKASTGTSVRPSAPIELALHREYIARKNAQHKAIEKVDAEDQSKGPPNAFIYSNVALRRMPLAICFKANNAFDVCHHEVVQIYAVLDHGSRLEAERLIGWERVVLEAQAETIVSFEIDPKLFANFNTSGARWDLCDQAWIIIKTLGHVRHAQMIQVVPKGLMCLPRTSR